MLWLGVQPSPTSSCWRRLHELSSLSTPLRELDASGVQELDILVAKDLLFVGFGFDNLDVLLDLFDKLEIVSDELYSFLGRMIVSIHQLG